MLNKPLWFEGGPIPIQLCFVATRKSWKRLQKQIGRHDPVPETSGRFLTYQGDKTKELVCVIWVDAYREDVNEAQVAGLIAHESVHLSQSAIKGAMNTKQRHDELEAYLVQWAFQACYGAWLNANGE